MKRSFSKRNPRVYATAEERSSARRSKVAESLAVCTPTRGRKIKNLSRPKIENESWISINVEIKGKRDDLLQQWPTFD